MKEFRARLRSALVVSIVATAVSLPVTALAARPPISRPTPPIDVPGLPNLGCGNGNGNGNECSTTTTTPVPVPTTVPVTVPTTVPVTVPSTVPVTVPSTVPVTVPSTVPVTVPTTVPGTFTVPGRGPGTVPGTVPVAVPATTVPVPPATPPGHTTSTTAGDLAASVPADGAFIPPGSTRAERARTAVVPVGPPSVGLTGFNTAAMPLQIAGAVKMLEGRDDEVVEDEPVTEVSAGPMSGGFHDLLSPVLPPALVDAVASPLVIMDALYDAFTSSGQALIVPGIAFLFGFGVPGIRRRITLDEAIG